MSPPIALHFVLSMLFLFLDRNNADLAIIVEILNYHLCLRYLRFFVVSLGLLSWWEKVGLRQPLFVEGATAGVR